MKTVKSFIFLFFAVLFLLSVNVDSFASLKDQNEKTKVYYFHSTRRCPTCMAIEKETNKVLKEQPFSDAVENGDLVFKTFNIEDALNKKLVKELDVTGSALIVLKGEEKIDLTSKGFLYGLKQPEKLRQALREALND